jgi:hypothetical protein
MNSIAYLDTCGVSREPDDIPRSASRAEEPMRFRDLM